jgi:hypothetical protein
LFDICIVILYDNSGIVNTTTPPPLSGAMARRREKSMTQNPTKLLKAKILYLLGIRKMFNHETEITFLVNSLTLTEQSLLFIALSELVAEGLIERIGNGEIKTHYELTDGSGVDTVSVQLATLLAKTNVRCD